MRSYRKKRKARQSRRKRLRGGAQEKCIFVPLHGGLGNQLYVYAAGIVAKNKLKLPLCITRAQNNMHSKEDYATTLFKQGEAMDESTVKSRINASTKIIKAVNPHNSWTNANIPDSSNTNVGLEGGFFQNYKSIHSAIPTIREDFSNIFKERFPGFKETIQPTSAFMHVRRGDYGPSSLNSEYYQRGLKELDAADAIKDIYILSDDIPWCKEQKWQSSKSIQWFESPDEVKGMYLMSLCQLERLCHILPTVAGVPC